MGIQADLSLHFTRACYLRNKFDFLSVHENMNTSGLMHDWDFTLTLHETRGVHDLMNRQKSNLLNSIFYVFHIDFRR